VIAILLALGAAVSYGLSDFVGGVFSKRASPWAVAFVGQVAGAVLMLGLSVVVAGDATGTDFGWAVLAGIGNGLGTVFLYRGLSSGRMGVVAPRLGRRGGAGTGRRRPARRRTAGRSRLARHRGRAAGDLAGRA